MQFTIFKDLIHDLCVARRLIVDLNDNGCFLYGVPTSRFQNKGVAI